MVIPADLASELIAFGADQALIWTGQSPDRNRFFYQLGRLTEHLRHRAWERETPYVDNPDHP